MKTPAFQLVASTLFGVCVSLAMPSSADAASDGITRLINVTSMKTDNANDGVLMGADKQRDLIAKKKQLANVHAQLEGAAPAPTPTDPSVALSQQIVDDVAAIAAFESTASAGGLDDAELKRLAELVGIAQKSVDAALADAKRQMAAAKTTEDKELAKLQLRTLRTTMKAHRQTSVALKTLAKRLAA